MLLFSILIIWMFKTFSLPKIYHHLGNKRSIHISEFRRLEKLAYKVVKWKLDIQYFNDCQFLGICPAFLKFKYPSRKAYNDVRDINYHVVQKQIDVVQTYKEN